MVLRDSYSLAADTRAPTSALLLEANTVLAQPFCFADSLGLTLGLADPCADPRM